MKKMLLSCIAAAMYFGATAQSWSVKADMPAGRKFSGAAAGSEVIYVIGGIDNVGVTADNFAYSPLANTWSSKTPMTYARGEFGVATVNGKIYAIGGYDGSAIVNYVEEYDPATDAWTTKAAMPTARSQFSLAVVQGIIYVTGGYPGSFTSTEAYNPATNTWTTKAPMPFGLLQNNGGVCLNNKFYVCGGKNLSSSVTYNSVYVYTPGTDSWTTAAAMPATRFGGATAVLHHKVYYFGGSTSVLLPTFNTDFCFDSVTQVWTSATPLLRQRTSSVAVTYGDEIYLFGGTDSNSNVVPWTHKFNPGTTGISGFSNNERSTMSVYPNPSNGSTVFLQVNTPSQEHISVTIYNTAGQLVKTIGVDNNEQSEVTFDVPGIYFIKAISNNLSLSSVVTIQQ